jgi:threonine/homoserine/homoserine lactone efflux protein
VALDRSMMDASRLAFTAVAALVVLTPGADTLLVVRNVLGRGRRAGLATTAGIGAGCVVHAGLSVLGPSVILVRSAAAFVRLAGAAYLVWLGLRSLRGAWRPAAATAVTTAPVGGVRRSFVEGAPGAGAALRRAGYRPFQSAGRFSRNARTPSWKSSER